MHARAAVVKDVVTRSISGHLTAGMQEHRSSPWESEQREGLAKVVDLAEAREAHKVAPRSKPTPRGVKGGVKRA